MQYAGGFGAIFGNGGSCQAGSLPLAAGIGIRRLSMTRIAIVRVITCKLQRTPKVLIAKGLPHGSRAKALDKSELQVRCVVTQAAGAGRALPERLRVEFGIGSSRVNLIRPQDASLS